MGDYLQQSPRGREVASVTTILVLSRSQTNAYDDIPKKSTQEEYFIVSYYLRIRLFPHSLWQYRIGEKNDSEKQPYRSDTLTEYGFSSNWIHQCYAINDA
jgi:hypothetical protein